MHSPSVSKQELKETGGRRSIQLPCRNRSGAALRLLPHLRCRIEAVAQIDGGVALQRRRPEEMNLTSVDPSGFGTRMRVASSISTAPFMVP